MDESMTLPEIERCFPSEWFLVADPELDEHLQIIRGRVVCHSKDRDELDRRALEVRPKSAASVYTGAFPEDLVVVL